MSKRDGSGPLKTAKALVEQGKTVEALVILRRALERRPEARGLFKLYVPLLVAHGQPDEARDGVISLAKRFPKSPALPEIFRALIERDRSKAREVALQLSDQFGDDPDIACLACEGLLETRGNHDGALALCHRGLMGPDLNASTLRLARQLLQLGGREEVAAWSGRMKERAEEAAPALRSELQTLLRNQLLDAEGSAIDIHRGPPGTDTVLFVFCGLQNQPGVTSEKFGQLIEDLPVHWVLLRDPDLLMYLKGIPELGPDLASTAQALSDLADDLGAGRRLCFGNSAGGYAALRYGDVMDVDGVLCMGALTSMTEESMRADGRAAAVADRMLQHTPGELLDMRECLLARERPLPVHLHFGVGMPEDAAYAQRLADVPGVTLHPANFNQHGVIKHLVNTGVAKKVLADFILDTTEEQG